MKILLIKNYTLAGGVRKAKGTVLTTDKKLGIELIKKKIGKLIT